MTDIPNKKYITINEKGIFVGGKPAITYHGQKIYAVDDTDDTKRNFAVIQIKNPKIQELHVGAFETKGIFAKPGNPSGGFGQNAWCRVKLFDGRLGPWVFCHASGSASDCAHRCVNVCCVEFLCDSAIRSALLKFTEAGKAEKKGKEQYETISVIRDGIYRITIEKIKQQVR